MTPDDRGAKTPPADAADKPDGRDQPAAGAHAAPHLINEEATPGSGILPDSGSAKEGDADGASG